MLNCGCLDHNMFFCPPTWSGAGVYDITMAPMPEILYRLEQVELLLRVRQEHYQIVSSHDCSMLEAC